MIRDMSGGTAIVRKWTESEENPMVTTCQYADGDLKLVICILIGQLTMRQRRIRFLLCTHPIARGPCPYRSPTPATHIRRCGSLDVQQSMVAPPISE